jgi:hypothetical protein
MTLVTVRDALAAATLEQKDRLLELAVQRQNLLEDLAELARDYKANKKELDEPLNRIEVEMFALLEEVATGQSDLFPGGDDGSTEEEGGDADGEADA